MLTVFPLNCEPLRDSAEHMQTERGVDERIPPASLACGCRWVLLTSSRSNQGMYSRMRRLLMNETTLTSSGRARVPHCREQAVHVHPSPADPRRCSSWRTLSCNKDNQPALSRPTAHTQSQHFLLARLQIDSNASNAAAITFVCGSCA